jgi:transcriptional regulator with XRE-family HTH domain
MTEKGVSNKLKEMRLRRGFTQRQLAMAAGTDQTYISTLECRDDVAARVDTLARIAGALDCLIDDLVPDQILNRTGGAS